MAFAALLIGGFILTRARLGRLMGILMLLIYAVYIYGLVNGFDILGLFLTPPA
jgi:cation:H+ antiporter